MLPNPSCLISRNIVGVAPTADAHILMQFVKQPVPNAALLGVCLAGPFKANFLIATWEQKVMQPYTPPADGNAFEVEVYAFEGNALGATIGDKLQISIEALCLTEDMTNVLGCVFDAFAAAYAVTLTVGSCVSGRKKRSQIKYVQLAGGQTLNREGSMRALVAWLDKHNRDLAPGYNLEKLVWCEENNSLRCDRKQVRVFYRIDLGDNNKKKVCANATAAIEYMQQFTQTDCYEDLLHRSHEYALS